MNLKQRIDSFVQLGQFLNQFSNEKIEKNENSEINNLFFSVFELQIKRAHESNGWFTKENVLFAFESIAKSLTRENLEKWTSTYQFSNSKKPKKIAIIMAGNIPLVGFHDLLSVLISGNKAIVKLSSNDKHFLPLVVKFLEHHNPIFKHTVEFTQGKLENFNAVIATGSNNTARYFEHYFGKYPHIIRKNRNSIAILTGSETQEELELLGNDIFKYFGLGCRSVSKIYVPSNYDFDLLFKALYKFKDLIKYKKYENNYDYNKAVYIMSQFNIIENGFVMLKEDSGFASPIASLFYEYYSNEKSLFKMLDANKENIQCIVSGIKNENFVKFGESQHPKLWDYADGVDTLKFLTQTI